MDEHPLAACQVPQWSLPCIERFVDNMVERVGAGASVVPFEAGWREQAAAEQEAALPGGSLAVSCSAPVGVGGLGRHLRELLDASDRRGLPSASICASAPEDTGREGVRVSVNGALRVLGRASPALHMWRISAEFDAVAARRLPRAEHLLGFNGTSLAQCRAARRGGYSSVSIVAANSHYRHVLRQHALAYRRYPLEKPWATRLLGRNLAEYREADRLLVSSRYVAESFLAEGFSEERLSSFPLTPDERYRPASPGRDAATFNVVYVGILRVHKGVPLLIDAFSRLQHADLRLILVGGWATRGMRRFVEEARARDPRISVSPGDPRPHFRAAAVCVHPAYEDGFAYAPAEALACGVPVIVSEDTGMKELVDQHRNGVVIPTDELGALTDAIEAAYRDELIDSAPAANPIGA